MADATYLREQSPLFINMAAAANAGELRQGPDGRAYYLDRGAMGAASTDTGVKYRDNGQATITKTTGIVFLSGGRVYWDRSARSAHFKTVNDQDFYVGVAVGDAASADTSMTVMLNVEPRYEIDIRGGTTISQSDWTSENTDGLGVSTMPGGTIKLAFDAVVEAAQAAMYSERSIPQGCNGIVEIRWKIQDNGDDAALDLDLGVASGTHATDFESITNYVAFHLDGNTLDLDAHSKDGVANVAITDTTINVVEGTYVECWIDLRNPADVQLYVDAVNVLPASVFTLGTGPFYAIIHMEKTSNDTVADLRVSDFRVRNAEQ